MNTQGAVLTSIGNSKKGTGTDKITANSRSSSGIGQMLFERCSSCCCYCVKSEFFCPRWLNEKLFALNNGQTKDVACDSWAEGCCDWFLRVPGALVLSRDERTYKNKLDTKKSSRATEDIKENLIAFYTRLSMLFIRVSPYTLQVSPQKYSKKNKTKNGESLNFLRFSSETRDWTGDLMIMNHAL